MAMAILDYCVCPQCGSVKFGYGPKQECKHCNIKVINTGVTINDFVQWDEETQEKWKLEMIQKYAPNASAEAIEKRAQKEAADKERELHQPKCPTCGSPHVGAVTGIQSSIPFALQSGGVNSSTAGKTFRCFNCGYTW